MSDIGWARDKEDWRKVDALEDIAGQLQMLVGSYHEVALDPREILVCHNQGSMGSCRGHSGTTSMEWVWVLQTETVPAIALSRAFLYFETQRKDGIRGDRGSTIMGGVEVMQQVGVPLESLWKYPSRYDPERPANWQEVLENAAQFKIERAVRLQTYEALRTFLGSGQGAVDCGIAWRQEYAAPVVERYRDGGGGHAIACPTLSERVNRRGEPYVWMFNSHGERSGIEGWTEWSPDFIRGAMRNRMNVFVGLSDMPNVEPREFTVEDLKKKLRV